ncbi:hypothetical protein ILUMI_16083, partial [Ignelater luminosus]
MFKKSKVNNRLENITKEATEEAIPFKKCKKEEAWWDEECRIETEKRNNLRIKAIHTRQPEVREAYKEQRAKVKKDKLTKKERIRSK